MIQQPDKPLAPLELFQRGIEITREIRGRIEETRTYYLGQSSREPEEPLSEAFDPEALGGVCPRQVFESASPRLPPSM